MVISKPDLTRIWAGSAPGGNVIDPDTTVPGKFSAGWLAEVPPFEHFNYIQRYFSESNAYNNEQGVNEWDAITVYPVKGIVKGSDGSLYTAILEQAGNNPTTDDGTNWSLMNSSKRDVFGSVADMRSYDLDPLAVVRTVSYYEVSSLALIRGPAEYQILTLADWQALTGFTTPDNFGDQLLDNGHVAMLSRANMTFSKFGIRPDSDQDQTDRIHSAFGGAGTTPDNWEIFAEDGLYFCVNLRVYRAGETLRNFKFTGQSKKGVKFVNSTPGKGIVVGEPDARDGIWGDGSINNTIGVEFRNFSHEFGDIGFWFVNCRDILVDNVEGFALLCVALGNDSWDDCFNATLTNITRGGIGRNVSPDAWYSIGLYRVTGFNISGFNNNGFLSSDGVIGVDAPGVQITINDCSYGTITGNTIHQSIAFGNGIALLVGTNNVTVSGNTVVGCGSGITTFGTTHDNFVTNNNVLNGTVGLNISGDNTTFANNNVTGNIIDLSIANLDATGNIFFNNNIKVYSIDASNAANQQFITGNYFRRWFRGSDNIVKYFPPGQVTERDANNKKVIDTIGGSRFTTSIEFDSLTNIRNIAVRVNRLVASTSINCYLEVFDESTGATIEVAQNLDVSATLGFQDIVFPVGAVTVDALAGLRVIIIPTGANIVEIVGIKCEVKELRQPMVGD